MTIQVTTLRWVPAFAQGYVRDLWVRWALEEAGRPYEVLLIDPETQASAPYRLRQPFGQVPAYKDDTVEMFESGAIVLHIADTCEALSPKDAAGRARAVGWVFAAMNSVEPPVRNLLHLDSGAPWAEALRPKLEATLKDRLAALSAWLGDKDHLEGRFTAGDLMMTGVLRELVETGLLEHWPNLDAHRRRCEARPAFGRALEAQMRSFRENAPA